MSIYTQREHNGLYELTDVARAELIDSKYYNGDLAPTSISQRTWTTYNVSSLWIGMSICLPTYALSASLVALGLSPLAALINVTIGNLLVLIPMQLNSHAGTKYGVPYPVFARLAFGPRGAHIASIARGIVGCGWVGIQTWFGGKALHLILMTLIPNFSGNQATLFVTCFIFWSINISLAYRGPEWIRKLESWGAPFLGILTIALLIWATLAAKAHGNIEAMDILNLPMNQDKLAEGGGFWAVFAAGLTSNLAFWSTLALNIPDFSRYAKSQRTQFLGQLYGMPTTLGIFALISAYVTAATSFITPDGSMITDPAEVVTLISNSVATVLGAAGIIIATLTTNIAANFVAPANGFSNLAPKKISYKIGVIITGILAMIMQPWQFMKDGNVFIYDWLGLYGVMLAPIAGIFLADYYIVKKKNMDVMSLFQAEEGRYWYKKGFNYIAFFSWLCGCIPPILGKIISSLHWMTNNGYLISFFISLIIYPILMKTSPHSLVLSDEMESMTER
ncbi:NCS1 family nucleobase:cation symporter-1 [Anaerovorax sp. IOR16]|uniref:NCS1 family nucleobase:cation symporter-1 n=1 Tax=Anaerovorax sp. IOR16 TaxID=2773458 RepID=UPI0019D14BD8|nr:NCS1 family nucleobase:cation symporter-1 [Anaerovorax sp. IOR16]